MNIIQYCEEVCRQLENINEEQRYINKLEFLCNMVKEADGTLSMLNGRYIIRAFGRKSANDLPTTYSYMNIGPEEAERYTPREVACILFGLSYGQFEAKPDMVYRT